ncbi:MAG: FtsX-like permease family protein [Clostridia bacterium]|nr:FtsX-like permease family protein [Clostridia bacterium]
MLWRKVFRDLKGNKGTYLACMVIMIIAILIFTSFSNVADNLRMSQQNFYQNQNFADGFIEMEALPFGEINKLQKIQGIKQIEGRMVKDVQVWAPDSEESVYLRLVSIDPLEDNPLNGVFLTQGIPLKRDEMKIWLDSKFFEAHNLQLNDEIEIIAGGKKRALTIAGVGQSPEFIYALRTSADVYPDPMTFGIAFVPLEIMEKLFGERAFNNVIFSLKPGVKFDFVKDTLEWELKPYGVKSIFPRADQVSHLLLETELENLETMAQIMPVMFLAIAAMILYISLKRLTEQQRGQIGILKAFGYTRREIIGHYLTYPLIIALGGSIPGGLLGSMLSGYLAQIYQVFFNMPDLSAKFSPRYFFLGIILSLVFSLWAGYQGCKNVLRLEPAQALRPPAPPGGGPIWLEKISFFWNMLTVQGMMAVRNLSRNKGRSIFIFLGIMFCFAMSGFTWSMNDLIQTMLYDQYEKVEVYDIKLSLMLPLDQKDAARELAAFPGVLDVEPMAEIPVTLQKNWLEKDVSILGIPENSQLYIILDNKGRKIPPPKEGLLLSERLAALLEVDIGSKLRIDTPLIDDWSPKELEVTGIIPQYVGMGAYMELNALQQFLGQGPLATSFMLKTAQGTIKPLQEKYRHSPFLAAIEAKDQKLGKMQEMMASYGSTIYLFALISMIIGFAIIYSSSTITLSERSRELASMMVLGMTPREVLSVITFEQWFLAWGAMAAGIPMSKLMLGSMSQALSSDVFTMPVIITPSSYLLAFLVTAASIGIAQLAAARKVTKLSLVEVLKARE